MQAVTRQRASWLIVIGFAAYILCLALLGLAFGFDHASTQWLIAASLTALAVGMAASLVLRIVVLVIDPAGRAAWWTNAASPVRLLRAVSLVARGIAVVAVMLIARGV